MSERSDQTLRASGLNVPARASLERQDALFVLTDAVLLYHDASGTRRVTLRDLARIHSDQEGTLRVETPAGTALSASLVGFDPTEVQSFFRQVRDVTAQAKQLPTAPVPGAAAASAPAQPDPAQSSTAQTAATQPVAPTPAAPPAPRLDKAPAPVTQVASTPTPRPVIGSPEPAPTIVLGEQDGVPATPAAPTKGVPGTPPAAAPKVVTPPPPPRRQASAAPVQPAASPAPSAQTPLAQTPSAPTLSAPPAPSRLPVPSGAPPAAPAAPKAPVARTKAAPVSLAPTTAAPAAAPVAAPVPTPLPDARAELLAQAGAVAGLGGRLRLLAVILMLAALGLAYFLFTADTPQPLNALWVVVAGGVGAVALTVLASITRLLATLAQVAGARVNGDG